MSLVRQGLCLVFAGLLAGLLTGCAELPLGKVGLSEPGPAELDRLLAEQEYGRALEMLRQVSDGHPQRETLLARRREVVALAQQFENETLDHMADLEQAGKWAEGIRTLHNALLKLPDSRTLQEKRSAYLKRHAHTVRKLEAQSDIARAQWLIKELHLREEIARIDPDDLSAQGRVAETRKSIDRIATNLVGCGYYALRSGDNALLQRCLDQAKMLEPSDTVHIAIAGLEEELTNHREQERRRAARIASRRSSEQRLLRDKQQQRAALSQRRESARLKALLEKSLQDKDARQSKELLTRLHKVDDSDPDLRELDERLQVLIDAEVQKTLERGSTFYRQGQFEMARKVWSEALPLDPSNRELLANIDRADRVLRKLKELQDAGTGESPTL